MVQGLKFLSKKGFNPQNQTNRKQVWERQQASAKEQERLRKRQQQLDREREDEELARVRHGDVFGKSQSQLRFMYDAPPGMESTKQNGDDDVETDGKPAADSSRTRSSKGTENGSINEITKIRSGDDAAAAAFRQMLAAQTSGTGDSQNNGTENDGTADAKPGFAPVLQGSTAERIMGAEKSKGNNTTSGGGASAGDALSALEKSVGRKLGDGALTLQEQVERFPQLQNAPMVKGMSGTNVNVSFKPLGAQVRNIKCLACGVWGHSRGERECKLTGWDPFSMSSSSRPSASTLNKTPASGVNPSHRGDKKQESHGDGDKMQHDRKSSSATDRDDDRRSRKKRRKKESRRRDKKHRRHDDHSYESESDSSISSTSSSGSESTGSDDHHRRRKHHNKRKKHSSSRSKHRSSSSRRKKRSRHREEFSTSKRHHRRHDSDSD